MKLRKMEIADELFQGKLEISVEYIQYHEMGGPSTAETYVYLSKEEMIALRNHITKILETA